MKSLFRKPLSSVSPKSLKRGLILFFLALAIPTGFLIQQSYSQLKWQTFHQHQLMADELARRIDHQFLQLINKEEQRPFTDYAFLNVVGEIEARFFQRSPLSHYPLEETIPGLIGYFQVDETGVLTSPIMPEKGSDSQDYGISNAELVQRTKLYQQLETVLSENNLVKEKPPVFIVKQKKDREGRSLFSSQMDEEYEIMGNTFEADEVQAVTAPTPSNKKDSVQNQIAFDQLTEESVSYSKQKPLSKLESGKNDMLKKEVFAEKKRNKKVMPKREVRREKNRLPEVEKLQDTKLIETRGATSSKKPPSLRINTFESEIDPFEFSQLVSGHFVLYRKVWLNKQRYIQGILFDQTAFLQYIIKPTFLSTALSNMSLLALVYQDTVLDSYTQLNSYPFSFSHELDGELLYQTQLSEPLSHLQLRFNIIRLPTGAGADVIIWLAFILSLVLLLGFYLMYRLGLGQIKLANQQQDFVSAVSHELKTPLTSIRMYGEILREGWASEEKKKTYYDFIFDESERLSRLINNVLHLAKMTRNKHDVILKPLTISELMDGIQSKVSSQIERAGFEFELDCHEGIKQHKISIEPDWFSQVMINLVDNSIKFSAKSDTQKIIISCEQTKQNKIQFTVRDYGPGVDKQQINKIFTLFYRTENELTRETVGTGIGLALVHQMVVNMNGQINVVNKEPGAEFQIVFSKQG